MPTIRSILVVTDLSSREDSAVQRARLLALQHGATLKLLHAPAGRADGGHPPPPGRLAQQALQLEAELGQEVGVLAAAAGGIEAALAAASRDTDLLVTADRRDRAIAALWRGQPAVRLLRAFGGPVLVTRPGAAQPYTRVLVATDLHDDSGRLVEAAARLEPAAAIELFHALSIRDEAKLRSAEAPEWVIRQFRERRQAYAEQRMRVLAATARAAAAGVASAIGRGDPAQQIALQQARGGAGLVVVGKKKAAAWGDFLCGSVASRVLAFSAGDVFVLPKRAVLQESEAGGRTAAARTIAGPGAAAIAASTLQGGTT